MILLDEYPYQRKMDVRSALCTALALYLKGLDLSLLTARRVHSFKHVFAEWPEQEDRFEPPSACVLPGEGAYEDRSLTPSPMEETWYPEGQEGFVLWLVAEYTIPLDIYVRATDRGQRWALIGALEDAFVPADLGSAAFTSSDTYGILLPVPDYYDRTARFSLRTSRVDDNAEAAGRRVREGVVGVEARCQHVVVRPAKPMRVRADVTPETTGG